MKNKYTEDHSGEMTEALAVLMEKTSLEKVLEGYAYGVKWVGGEGVHLLQDHIMASLWSGTQAH